MIVKLLSAERFQVVFVYKSHMVFVCNSQVILNCVPGNWVRSQLLINQVDSFFLI